jgi:V/A-type H+-transporting ATPase subunit I
VLKAKGEFKGEKASGEETLRDVDGILATAERLEALAGEADALKATIRKYAPYGDFDPQLLQKLLDRGIDVASVADIPKTLPQERLGVTRGRLEKAERDAAKLLRRLAAADVSEIAAGYPELLDAVQFEAAKENFASAGAVAHISGWIAGNRTAELLEAAATNGWGVAVRDPAAGEIPPTLVEPPKFFKPVKALFDGLGIAPAYTEADVSVPFMCYFSLFFAMLVGDGAYGAIFLAATLWGWRKYRASPGNATMRSWLVMLTVFSSATVLWGLLSNTWFGAGIPACAGWPTVKWLADPSYNNMMLLCFTIGVSHLMLARIWNGVCRINDTTCIAEFGWAGVLLFMYFTTCSIVGIFPAIPTAMFPVFAVSLVAVFGFTVKPSELKTRGAELGMLPLNIMSALGDIISYVRLFAVGLASVKVAENFNAMATGLLAGADEWWAKALMAAAMAAILLVVVTLVTDFIALGTITVSLAGPVGMWMAGSGWMIPLILAIATVVMILKHRENIVRIRNKEEIGLLSTIKGENRMQ